MRLRTVVTRGADIESVHEVEAVVVDSNGKLVFSTAHPDYPTCIRSSLKPFQAAAAVHAGAVDGAGFDQEELALMCASHNGEPIHVETAQRMLKKLGSPESVYECGSHPPYDRETRLAGIRNNSTWTPFHNNCSGKHAGMLALSQFLGANPTGYTERNHPVQETIFSYLNSLIDRMDYSVGVDGCSAPTPFLPLQVLAQLFVRLAKDNDPTLERVYTAMTTHPYLIAGRKRFDTDFMTALNGRGITKVGGEGVRGLAIRRPDGQVWGLALKVLDGNQRANAPATMAVLHTLELLTSSERDALKTYERMMLKNHRNLEIGEIYGQLVA